MKKRKVIFIIFFLIFPAFASSGAPQKSRTVVFTYSIALRGLPLQTREIKIWVPYPAENEFQKVTPLDLTSPSPHSITSDRIYNNKMLYYIIRRPKSRELQVKQSYKASRFEFVRDLKNGGIKKENEGHASIKKYLKANKFISITPETRKIAKEISGAAKTTVEKARSLYRYIWENYTYDKTVPGWGSGDVNRFCLLKKGNCTDFHTLFISVANAMGIPAKFVIGFSLPKKNSGGTDSYHCWLEFYDPDTGWVPLDIAEAWKDRSKFNYNFGAVDENRIEFTHGRDITLSPAQNNGSLNYFIYPYVEVDGKEFTDVKMTLEFKNVKQERSGI